MTISLENRPDLQVTSSGMTLISSISTVLYAGVYLDAWLSSPASVCEVQVLKDRGINIA